MSKKNIIRIKKEYLPSDEQAIYEKLFFYFNCFDIEISEEKDAYAVSLSPSDFMYCEDMNNALNEMFNISVCDVSSFYILKDKVSLCLSENWIPYLLSRMVIDRQMYKVNTAIIHVDDHSDLMSPYISYYNTSLYDMLTGKEVILGESNSISAAVKSGAITIGSMLTTALYSFVNANVYHLKYNSSEGKKSICRCTTTDTFFGKEERRISVILSDFSKGENYYYITPNPKSIVHQLSNEENCILHIDMDYFNNRFNGSTSWSTENYHNNPSICEQKHRMDELCQSVKDIDAIIPINYVLIGVSPSFYPCEYWNCGLEYLINNLKIAHVDVKVILNEVGIKMK